MRLPFEPVFEVLQRALARLLPITDPNDVDEHELVYAPSEQVAQALEDCVLGGRKIDRSNSGTEHVSAHASAPRSKRGRSIRGSRTNDQADIH